MKPKSPRQTKPVYKPRFGLHLADPEDVPKDAIVHEALEKAHTPDSDGPGYRAYRLSDLMTTVAEQNYPDYCTAFPDTKVTKDEFVQIFVAGGLVATQLVEAAQKSAPPGMDVITKEKPSEADVQRAHRYRALHKERYVKDA